MTTSRTSNLLIPAGALLSALVFLIHPDVPSTGAKLLEMVADNKTRWAVAHGLGFADGIVWVFGLWLLADRLHPLPPRTAVVTRIMMVAGSVAISAISTAELMFLKIVDGVHAPYPATLAAEFRYGGTGLPVGAIVVLQ